MAEQAHKVSRHRGWMSQFLAAQAERQAEMLGLIAARLERDLKGAGSEQAAALPSEHWLKVARWHQDGYRMLAQQELEAAKVQLMARRVAGRAPLSDEEYTQQMADLGQDALRALTDEQVEEERARRHRLPVARAHAWPLHDEPDDDE